MSSYVKNGQDRTKQREYHEDAVFRANVDSYAEESELSFEDSRELMTGLHSVEYNGLIIHGPTTINIAVSDKIQLKVLRHFKYNNLQANDVTTQASWITSDAGKATVSGGEIEGIGAGTALITAKLDEVTSNEITVVVS